MDGGKSDYRGHDVFCFDGQNDDRETRFVKKEAGCAGVRCVILGTRDL